jgi:hypothetical protein
MFSYIQLAILPPPLLHGDLRCVALMYCTDHLHSRRGVDIDIGASCKTIFEMKRADI